MPAKNDDPIIGTVLTTTPGVERVSGDFGNYEVDKDGVAVRRIEPWPPVDDAPAAEVAAVAPPAEAPSIVDAPTDAAPAPAGD